MRAYEITFRGKTRYAGTQSDAKAAKDKVLEDAGLGPRSKEATVEEIDIPTGKAELLSWINDLAAKADPAEPSGE